MLSSLARLFGCAGFSHIARPSGWLPVANPRDAHVVRWRWGSVLPARRVTLHHIVIMIKRCELACCLLITDMHPVVAFTTSLPDPERADSESLAQSHLRCLRILSWGIIPLSVICCPHTASPSLAQTARFANITIVNFWFLRRNGRSLQVVPGPLSFAHVDSTQQARTTRSLRLLWYHHRDRDGP